MKKARKPLTSRKTLMRLLAVIALLLAIPLVVILLQEEQDQRQFADEKNVVETSK